MNRKKILITVASFFVVCSLFTQTADEASALFKAGNNYFDAGDYDNAILYHKKALKIHKRIYGEDSLVTADSYYNIGNAYFKKFDCTAALSHHKKALSIYKAKEGFYHADTARTYNTVGLDYERNRNYAEALDCFRQALEISITVFGENHNTTANSYTNIGSIYEEWYNYETALMYYQRALDIKKIVLGENNLDTAWSYHNVGNALYEKENCTEALRYYETSFNIREMLLGSEHIQIIYSYGDMGKVYNHMGDYDRALGCYEQALRLRKKLDPNHVYIDYSLLSSVYCNKGDYDTALQYAEKVLDDKQKEFGTEHRYVADSYYNIATILCEKCSYEQALVYHKKALNIYIKEYGEVSPAVANVYTNMGVIYASTLDYGNALQYYDKALSINKHIFGEYSMQSALIHFNLAGFFYKIDPQFAVYYWRKAFKAYEKSSEYQKTISTLQSIIFYEIPIATSKPNDLPAPPLIAELDKEKMRLNIKEDLDTAFIRDTIALAAATVERARLDMPSLKSDILRKSLPVYYYGVDFEARHGNHAKAFEYAEMLRSRGFLDEIGLERAVSLDGVTDGERKQIKELTAQIASARKEIEKQNNLELKDRDKKKLTQTEKNLAAAEKSLAKLDDAIGKRIPQYAQLRNPQTVSAKSAQKWCGNDTAILEYVLWNPVVLENTDMQGETLAVGSYCLVITKQNVTAVPLDDSFDYAAAVTKLRESVIPKNARAKPTAEVVFEDVRNSLYEKLIAPVLPHIKGKNRLLIVPDGCLSFLPFDILRASEDEKMLCEQYAVSLSPSVSVSMIADNSRAKGMSMIAFGGAWYDSEVSVEEHRRTFSESNTSRNKRGLQAISLDLNIENEIQKTFILQDIQDNGPSEYFRQKNLHWMDLPGTVTELNTLKNNVFKGKGYEEYVQEAASEQTVKQLSKNGTLSTYPLLHFACHGYFDKSIATMSSILFSEVSGKLGDISPEDGYLTIPEVSLLKLDADLVCLSACETGLGEMKIGDGMIGLNRAFMVAGARRVGVTLWGVDDEATAEFMARMYKKIERNGMDYEQAYRRTKAEFQKSEHYSHPYYWAAFVLYE